MKLRRVDKGWNCGRLAKEINDFKERLSATLNDHPNVDYCLRVTGRDGVFSGDSVGTLKALQSHAFVFVSLDAGLSVTRGRSPVQKG